MYIRNTKYFYNKIKFIFIERVKYSSNVEPPSVSFQWNFSFVREDKLSRDLVSWNRKR